MNYEEKEEEVEDRDEGHLFGFMVEWSAAQALPFASGVKAVVSAGAVFEPRLNVH